MKKTKFMGLFILLISITVSFFYIKSYINSKKTIPNVSEDTIVQQVSVEKASKNILQTKIKSGSLSTDYKIDVALNDIDKFGFNTVNIPIVINIDNLLASNIAVSKESKDRAIQLITQLKGKNINIILEPYPWIGNGSLSETNLKPNDINVFFQDWRTKVLKVLIDDIAVPHNADVLNIGSNFAAIESEEKQWCDTIDYVRKYYKGLVTYRTNWWGTAVWDKETKKNYEKKLDNKLFSKLDFISTSTYFELTENETNTVENLVKAIQSTEAYKRKQNVKKEIKNFYDKWNKPIFFGELGFPRTSRASVHPWEPLKSNVINDTEQANCFEAYRRTFENESWFLGFSVFAVGEHSSDKLYYPSDKSLTVIKSWYGEHKN